MRSASASQTSEHRGVLIAFHMEIKTKRRGTARSLIHSEPPTHTETPASSPPALPLHRKTNSFSQFQPTEIRLSTSVFVKLKGLNSQWRAARRNFSLLVFPLLSITLILDSTKRSGKFTMVVNIFYMQTSGQFIHGNQNKMPFTAGDLFA